MLKNNKLKIISKIFSLLIFEILFIIYNLSLAPSALAQGFNGVMNNDLYRLQMGNLNSFSGESSGSNYNLSITSGETAPGLYSGTNFKVKAGFQYVPRGRGKFSFSISSAKVDFGTLTPTNPIQRRITLTVSNPSSPSYQVTASEDKPLTNTRTKDIIPNTTCDNGRCTKNIPGIWKNSLTYGFGYRCDGISVKSSQGITQSCRIDDLSFLNKPTSYKPFADSSKSEKAVIIMKGQKGTGQKANVTYKVNIPTSQATGKYKNTVTYIAVPSF
ncbi:MAG: hypothetical protein A3A51_04730 [Candidatus Levybacteria bacterium RIFCSPLOWO2_01_FULL_39_10]|nr:MAG: hypothetical protein A3A51_04730 [Candidatus Levybacteria bacterium RIFCSPLOWO2_01_FULL_39_10]